MSILLLNGDCLQVMKDLSGGTIDCFICDLPYGCLTNQSGESKGFKRESHKGTNLEKKLAKQGGEGVKWDIKIDLNKFWEQVKRLAKSDNTPVLMFATTKFGNELINSNPSWFRYDLVWDKGRGVSFLSANKMPMRSHEMIYVFSKAGAYYRRVDEDAPGKGARTDAQSNTLRKDNLFGTGLKRSNGAAKDKACVKSVIKVQKVGTFKQGHPTEKPMALYRWLLERYCPPGGTILDPTAGSFNSCFAAYDLNLHAIGIEKDEGFYNKASERADALQ